jgi:SAM-dependent methyltransferase
MDKLTIESIFSLGMKRTIPPTLQPPLDAKVPRLEFGGGRVPLPGAMSLDFPAWDASKDSIPLEDGSVGAIFAFHFFEHLTGAEAIRLLREVERVLVPGGVLTVVIPHRLSDMAFQDLDHKSFWTEDSWKHLLSNAYYDKNREVPWRLRHHSSIIIGIVARNLALMSQLEKT